MRSPAARRRPLAPRTIASAATWAGAAAIYITIGVFFVDFMLSIVVAIGYLLITTWIVPAAVRRAIVRRRRR